MSSSPQKLNATKGKGCKVENKSRRHLKVTKLSEGTVAGFMDGKGLLNTTLSGGFSHTLGGVCN